MNKTALVMMTFYLFIYLFLAYLKHFQELRL